MRSLALALVVAAFSASPASAAVIELDDRSSPEDNEPTIAIVVRASPGETNDMTVRREPGGIAIEDAGAPLTGACEPSGGGRFCRGTNFGVVDVFLGDGSDTLRHDYYGSVNAGAGDDDILVTGGIFMLLGGSGADRLDATGAMSAAVDYSDHTTGVTVRLNGLSDDGSAGEGDNVLGPVTGIAGGSGDDDLEAGATGSSLSGAGGDDRLVGSPERDQLLGGDGDDELLARGGSDSLTGGAGADILSGGEGLDEVSYYGTAPLRLSIGDGPNDGVSGEGDDIREDIEGLGGGPGDDILVGDGDPNRLIGYGGQDVLRGGGGGDELLGWGDGDELDGGAGADTVSTRPRRLGSAVDRALLADGQRDTLECAGAAPLAEVDAVDRLEECAPAVMVHRQGRMQRHRRTTLFVRCPVQTAVPCRGRLWIHLQGTRRNPQGGRRVSRVIRFGPIEAGERARIRILIRGPVPRHGCVYSTAVTRRGDGLDTRTVTNSVLRCLPG